MNIDTPCPNNDPLRLILKLQTPPPGGWVKHLKRHLFKHQSGSPAFHNAFAKLYATLIYPYFLSAPGTRAFLNRFGADAVAIEVDFRPATDSTLPIRLKFASPLHRAEYIQLSGGFGQKTMLIG